MQQIDSSQLADKAAHIFFAVSLCAMKDIASARSRRMQCLHLALSILFVSSCMYFTYNDFIILFTEPPIIRRDPCSPSPCGPNSQCREVNRQPVCSCLPNYIGSPPSCRPECVVSSECPSDKACVNQKCRDPCPNTCGVGAQCTVKNHNPICACPAGYTGDPFVRCSPQRKS
jgi:hypothetical protein